MLNRLLPDFVLAPMNFWSLLSIAIGVSLTLGGTLAVARGAEGFGRWLGLSPLPRGLILVGFAVSLPELAIVRWASRPEIDLPDLALGSLLGSVTAGYLLALAIGALALPVAVPKRLTFFAYPLTIVIALATFALAWQGEIGAGAGAILIAVGIAWPLVALFVGRTKRDETKERGKRSRHETPLTLERQSIDRSSQAVLAAACGIVAGAVAAYYGPMFLLRPAESFALRTGLGESTVGLTLVALLATLPEAFLLLLAAEDRKREAAAAIIVGSALFKLTAGLGLLAALSRDGLFVPSVAFEFAIPFAIAAILACVSSFYGLGRVSRATGLALFVFYVAYVIYLVVCESAQPAASESDPQTIRFYAMFLLAIGVIAVTSFIAILERLAQKARLADD